MRRKTMSIIGRIIGLILVVALAFGITWCATNWGKVQAEWDKLTGKDQQQEQVQPGTEEPGQEEPGTEEPHVHELSEWNIVVEPTCDSIGQERRACDCGYYEERDIPALGHDYVDGTCSRCGESDPNYVEEVASIDGLYYGLESDGSIKVFQIQDNKFVIFYGYTKNGDQSLIYFPQDWTTYLGGFGNSLTIEENDTQIICGISEYMERYKDNPELYEVYSNYFVYDKQTKELCVGKNKFVLTRIDSYNILPYEEPTFSIVDNKLLLTDMTQYDGTYSIYYKLLNASEGEDTSEYAYVAGNVTEFDLNLLINRDYMPMLVGRDYRIRVAFQTDGFDIYGGVASYTASVETEPDNSSSRYEHYCMMTDDMFENMDKAVINCTWKGQEYEVELTWNDNRNGYFYSWADAGIIISKVNDEYLIYTDGNIDASEFEINSAIGYFSNLGFETSTII